MWPYSFLLGLFIPTSLYFFPFMLEDLSHIATILASGAVVLAYVKFRHEKIRENLLTVMGQINFFRTEILEKHRIVTKYITSKNLKHNFSSHRIGYIEVFNYAWLYKNYRDMDSLQESLSNEQEGEEKIVGMINAMEQFAWSLILSGTTKDQPLYIVRDVFIEIVESFTHQILFLMADRPQLYQGIKQVYSEWAPKISRESEEEKLERISNDARQLISQESKK